MVGIGRRHGSRGPARRGPTGSSSRAWRAVRCWPRSRRPRRPAGPKNISNRCRQCRRRQRQPRAARRSAVDPIDPSKLVAVWVDNDPTMFADTDNEIRGRRGGGVLGQQGQSWLPMLAEPTNAQPGEPGVSTSPYCSTRRRPARRIPISYETSPSLGFDDSGNFYILIGIQRTAAGGVQRRARAAEVQLQRVRSRRRYASPATSRRRIPTGGFVGVQR